VADSPCRRFPGRVVCFGEVLQKRLLNFVELLPNHFHVGEVKLVNEAFYRLEVLMRL